MASLPKKPTQTSSDEEPATTPDGFPILHRYITVVGAACGDPTITVDVIDRGPGHERPYAYVCRACPEQETACHLAYARNQAQVHATACRAVPETLTSRTPEPAERDSDDHGDGQSRWPFVVCVIAVMALLVLDNLVNRLT